MFNTVSSPKLDRGGVSQGPSIGEALGKYSHSFHCTNCQLTQLLEIPRGTKVADFFPGECPGCGCDTLRAAGVPSFPKLNPNVSWNTVSPGYVRCKCITPEAHTHNYATPHPNPYR